MVFTELRSLIIRKFELTKSHYDDAVFARLRSHYKLLHCECYRVYVEHRENNFQVNPHLFEIISMCKKSN